MFHDLGYMAVVNVSAFRSLISIPKTIPRCKNYDLAALFHMAWLLFLGLAAVITMGCMFTLLADQFDASLEIE